MTDQELYTDIQKPHEGYQKPYKDDHESHSDNLKQSKETSCIDASHRSVRSSFMAGFVGGLLAVCLGLGGYTLYQAHNNVFDGQQQLPDSEYEDIELPEHVAQKVLPSIVSINSYGEASFDVLNPDDTSLMHHSLGSGVLISDDGYLVTNYHVVDGAAEIRVTVDEREYIADYIGSDSSSDIAVLKIDETNLPAIEIGESSSLVVGQWVMALGNPFGLENSVSTGIVSAIQRSSILPSLDGTEMVVYPNMIQTDAAINPGNSGGALVDKEGKLIGINTLINSYSGTSSGVGFAIPVDYVMEIVEQLIHGEQPKHAFLGVSIVTLSSDELEEEGVFCDSGVQVIESYENTAAWQAGLREGDIIVSFNDSKITSSEDLALAVRTCRPGDSIELTYYRDGVKTVVEVLLGSDDTDSVIPDVTYLDD